MKRTILTQAITILALALLTTINLCAQVKIGDTTPPVAGALLELSEGSITTKGLALPRVELVDLTTLTMGTNAIPNAGTLWQDHVGLMVYNTAKVETKANRICPGIHIWDGAEWQSLIAYPEPLEQKVAMAIVKRDFEYLDPDSPVGWPADKESDRLLGKYNLGSLGTFIDNRPNDAPQTYYHARFYVGYKTGIVTYNIQRSYNCDSNTAPNWISEGYEVENLRTFEDGIWMTDNLRAIVMPNGENIIQSANNSTTVPYYHYPDLQVSNRAIQGVLYNWAAAINMGDGTNGTTPDPSYVEQGGPGHFDVHIQGVCPDGWHLPSDQEWVDLENGIILKTATFSTTPDIGAANKVDYSDTGYRGTTHGTAMKTTNGAGGTSKPSSQGGFDGYLAGGAGSGLSNTYGSNARYWSASKNNGNAWYRYLYRTAAPVYRAGVYGANLLSVRCMKDN
ncbi:FISUMP domain-containing protein [Dysgonomonas sp. 25]|uniref:FISUMP domain-containing protein n=1 Tax=Dysgonomonas sp. 25 TaxID=2302933 RepID=UPI0013D5F238|nr:FISUMP domain-containing protein [Dysgonomonas sp. 25]NDV69060.1 hypothetical protein [Dysgonomonas sp. 25]